MVSDACRQQGDVLKIHLLGSRGGEGEHQDPQHRHRIRHLRKLGRRSEGK